MNIYVKFCAHKATRENSLEIIVQIIARRFFLHKVYFRYTQAFWKKLESTWFESYCISMLPN